MRKFNRTLDLARLQGAADALLSDGLGKAPDAEQVEKLMLLCTSMGGARPKAVVEDADGLWLAKFNKPGDRWNNARVEHAMLVLARKAGITAADSKLTSVGDRDVLLVKRFDRDKVKELHPRPHGRAASPPAHRRQRDLARRWSYVLLAEELRRVTARAKEERPGVAPGSYRCSAVTQTLHADVDCSVRYDHRRKITLALTPPKPKPFEIACSMTMCRASPATMSTPSAAASGCSRLRVGGAI